MDFIYLVPAASADTMLEGKRGSTSLALGEMGVWLPTGLADRGGRPTDFV